MDKTIETVRTFNRFFTRHVGAIDERFLGTETNLPEARLLFEIARREPVLANQLQDALRLDRGYLSRMLGRFEERGWIARHRTEADARARPISLTASGRAAFDLIDEKQRSAIGEDLERLSTMEQGDLAVALSHARLLLDDKAADTFTIRPFRTGEVSQIAARQSVLYAQSHGWKHQFESLVVDTAAAFLRNFKPGREQCWVADIDGVMAGAVFLTDEGNGIARLRLLHVEPFARRRGIGDALVRGCIGFAREKGYSRINLWTQTSLESARRIYARLGFTCISTEVHHEFGEPVQGEAWMLELANPANPEHIISK
ncbi:bifunctional helix-turn-helix transcriptional regulator/GNAT family N-acetyltransferase [Novosphingobium lindaniclasticum]